jgi:hypothetical protein
MKPAMRRALLGLIAAAVLAGVFMAYLSPHVVRDLAARVWACF